MLNIVEQRFFALERGTPVGRYLVLRKLVLCRQRMPKCRCIPKSGNGRRLVLVRQRLRGWPCLNVAVPISTATERLCLWHFLWLFRRHHAEWTDHKPRSWSDDLCRLRPSVRSTRRRCLRQNLPWCRPCNVVLHILVLGLCNLPNCTCFDGMARLLLESGEMRVKCRSRLRLQVGVTLWMSRPTPSWYLWWKGELCSRLWQQLRSLGQNRLPDGVGKWPQLGCHLCWQWILAANCLQLKVRKDQKSL